MIKIPEGYDNAPVYGTGEFENITSGGHICRIRAVREETTNGTRQLIVAFDLAEQDAQAGFYQRQYAQRLQSDVNAKWPGVYRQGIDGKGTPFFKGFITAVERSNPGYLWNWDENTLKGKLFGGVFGREEYMGTDGKSHWNSKIRFVRSVDDVLDAPVPEDKPMSAQQQPAYGVPAAPASPAAGNANNPYNDLPF